MSEKSHYAKKRKIDPSKTLAIKPDGTLNQNDRIEIGPTQLAFDEWHIAKLTPPNLSKMRQERLDRLTQEIVKRDLAGVLLFDPMNIRYASDTTNLQIWNAHNPFRACFVSVSGYMIMWDYRDNMLTSYNPLVKESRTGAAFFYFSSGDGSADDARAFAKEVDSIVREHAGDNRKIAVDKIMINGYKALNELNFDISDGEEVMEKTRSIKQPEEILAMRCAIHACEQSIRVMHNKLKAGMTEVEVWSYLHRENIRRGGEWIEARLAVSGPRTNPWLKECGPRVMQNGEFFAFDTDLIGCYGFCADISRTWLIGDDEPSDAQKKLYTDAYRHIQENMQLLKPGVSFKDLTFGGNQLTDKYIANRYPVKFHGVGLCDEWPSVYYPDDYCAGKFEYELEAGMIICVEAYMGEENGQEGVKLEEQVLITEDGFENLTRYPFEKDMLLD